MNKIIRLAPWCLVVTAAIGLAGCGDSAAASDARQQFGEAIDATKHYTQEEIQSMTTKLKERWTDMKAEIAKLEAEAKVRGGAAKADVDELIADLKKRANAAGERLDAAAGAGSDAARDSLQHAEKAMGSAKDAIAQAWAKLKK